MTHPADPKVVMKQSLLELLAKVKDPDAVLRWLSTNCGTNKPFVPPPRPPMLPRQRATFAAAEAFLKAAPENCEVFITDVRKSFALTASKRVA